MLSYEIPLLDVRLAKKTYMYGTTGLPGPPNEENQ